MSAPSPSFPLSRSLVLTLSRPNVFVTANAQPASKALRIIAELVVGVAEASPKGFSNFNPTNSMLMSTVSTGVKNFGSWGSGGMKIPCRDWGMGEWGKLMRLKESSIYGISKTVCEETDNIFFYYILLS